MHSTPVPADVKATAVETTAAEPAMETTAVEPMETATVESATVKPAAAMKTAAAMEAAAAMKTATCSYISRKQQANQHRGENGSLCTAHSNASTVQMLGPSICRRGGRLPRQDAVKRALACCGRLDAGAIGIDV
jgi:hypothetical protein